MVNQQVKRKKRNEKKGKEEIEIIRGVKIQIPYPRMSMKQAQLISEMEETRIKVKEAKTTMTCK